jgi:hypothetical protein
MGAVAISSSDPNAPFVSLPVTGTAQAGSLRAPKSFAFGKVAIGNTRKHTLTIKNLGLGVLHGSIDASSLGQGPFSIVGAAGDFTLNHGKTLKIIVQFVPTASGPASAALTIASDDPAHPSVSITLTGSGKARASVQPRALNRRLIHIHGENGGDIQ